MICISNTWFLWTHTHLHPKLTHDQFSCFCTAHRQTERYKTTLCTTSVTQQATSTHGMQVMRLKMHPEHQHGLWSVISMPPEMWKPELNHQNNIFNSYKILTFIEIKSHFAEQHSITQKHNKHKYRPCSESEGYRQRCINTSFFSA